MKKIYNNNKKKIILKRDLLKDFSSKAKKQKLKLPLICRETPKEPNN